MGCTPCANKRARQPKKYEWTDGKVTVQYDTELAAKAKVNRKGGSYKPL